MKSANEYLAKILEDKSLEEYSSLNHEWFRDNDFYEWIKEHYIKYSALPSRVLAVKNRYIKDIELEEPILYYKDEAKKEYLIKHIENFISKEIDSLRDSPEEFISLTMKMLSNIRIESASNILDYAEDALNRIDEYEDLSDRGGMSYLKWNHPLLDEVTGFIESTDLVTIAGKPGTGKTWFLLKLTSMLDRFLQLLKSGEETLPTNVDYNRPIIFISNEMNNKQLKLRLDAVNLETPYADLIKGNLTPQERRDYFKKLKTLTSNTIFFYNVGTVAEISSLIQLYNPLCIFIDGAYLLEAHISNIFERVTYITRTLKKIALSNNVPIYQTIQFKTKGGKKVEFFVDAGEDIPYGTYLQDSDILFTIVADKALYVLNLFIANTIKHRNNSLHEFYFLRNVLGSEFDFITKEDIHEDVTDDDLL